MKRFLVVSDLHVPVYQRDIPKKIYEIAKEVDGIIALGDYVDYDTVLTLETISKVFHGVYGNMDHIDVKNYLPERKVIAIENLTVALIHGSGAPYDLVSRLYKKFIDISGVNVVLYGHTHVPSHEFYGGIAFLNPGTATPGGTYGILEVHGSEYSFKVYDL